MSAFKYSLLNLRKASSLLKLYTRMQDLFFIWTKVDKSLGAFLPLAVAKLSTLINRAVFAPRELNETSRDTETKI